MAISVPMSNFLESPQVHNLLDYGYHLAAYKTATDEFRGVFLVTSYKNIAYVPVVEIPTPTTFKTERGARIEASALAYQLIHTGAISSLVPPSEESYKLTKL